MATYPIIDLINTEIFEKYYLQPLDGKIKTNLYDDKVERVIHGVMHASRTSIWINILIQMLRQMDHKDVKLLSDEDIFYLHIVALFHDAARKSEGKDHYEAESQEKCQAFLEAIGLTSERAFYYASLITTKERKDFRDAKIGLLRKLLQSADSVDISRTKSSFHINRMHLWQDFKKTGQENKLITFATHAICVIASQQDLTYDCTLMVEDKPFVKIRSTLNEKYLEQIKASKNDHDAIEVIDIPCNKEIDLKKEYEHSKDCYQRIMADVSNDSFLQSYIGENILANKNVGFEVTLTQLERQRIRAQASSVRLQEDFYIKSLRHGNIFQEFLDGILPPHKHHPLRRAPKKKYTVTGEGVILREEKKPQYTASEKKYFSKAQPITFCTPEAHLKPFNFSDTTQKLTGVILQKDNVLLSNRISTHDFGSDGRPSDFDDYETAEMYYFMHKQNLYAKKDLELFKQNITDPINLSREHNFNECLARLRWDINNIKPNFIFINKDTLETRFIAQIQAKLLKDRLLKIGLCSESYEVPICYYKPDEPNLHLKIYSTEEQKLDQTLAKQIANSFNFREMKYRSCNFEFLFFLSKIELETLLKFDQFEQQPLIAVMATLNQLHLIDYFIEMNILKQTILNETIKKMLESILISASSLIKQLHANEMSGDNPLPSSLLDAMIFLHIMLFNTINSNQMHTFQAILSNLLAYPPITSIVFANAEDKRMIILNAAIAQNKNFDYLRGILLLPDFSGVAFDKKGKTSLHYAAKLSDTTPTKLLLALDFPSYLPDKKGRAPLHYAAAAGHLENVKIIMEHLKNTSSEKDYLASCMLADKNRKTPLHLAIENNHLGIVKYILDTLKIDPNHLSQEGQSVLHFAISNLSMTILRHYLDVEPLDINKQDINGNSLLHHFVQNFHHIKHTKPDDAVLHLFIILIQSGAQLDLKNNVGQTAADLANTLGLFNIFSILFDLQSELFMIDFQKLLQKPETSIYRTKALGQIRQMNSEFIAKDQIVDFNKLQQAVNAIKKLDNMIKQITGLSQEEIDIAYQNILNENGVTRVIEQLQKTGKISIVNAGVGFFNRNDQDDKPDTNRLRFG